MQNSFKSFFNDFFWQGKKAVSSFALIYVLASMTISDGLDFCKSVLGSNALNASWKRFSVIFSKFCNFWRVSRRCCRTLKKSSKNGKNTKNNSFVKLTTILFNPFFRINVHVDFIDQVNHYWPPCFRPQQAVARQGSRKRASLGSGLKIQLIIYNFSKIQ